MSQPMEDAAVAEKAKRVAILALILFAIPILGWLTSLYVESSLDDQFRKAMVDGGVISAATYDANNLGYMKACGPNGLLAETKDATKLCSYAAEVIDSRRASLITAGIGVGLLLLIFIGKGVAGANRRRLSIIFGPLVRIVMVALAVSVIAQAGLLIYSIYTLEAAAIQRVHGGLLAIIGIGALLGCLQLLKSGLWLLKTQPSVLRAELLPDALHTEIYSLVNQVASKMHAQEPDNIVVGLEPNFFVTSNPVELMPGSQVLKGRTLFISLSLLHLLSRDELAAVIGHELGHYRGQDTEYSLKFAPIYSRLTTALQGMGSGDEAGSIALLPAMAVLAVCLNQFAEAERTIGRERELLADMAGAEAVSPDALASALVKVSLYAGFWTSLSRQHIELLAEGRYFENLAVTYLGVCNDAHQSLDWDEAKPIFAEYQQPHPVDTHPPLGMRLQALGVSLNDKDATVAVPAATPATTLIAGADEIEQRLTLLEIRWMEAMGLVVLPKAEPAESAA
jgi:Zn-dependent protease with chaperone function